MTIQEYIRIAVLGFPKEEFLKYREYFVNMNCEYCIFNGYSCKHPEVNDICIDYCVGNERKYKEWWK